MIQPSTPSQPPASTAQPLPTVRSAPASAARQKLPATPWGLLPPRLVVLYVAGEQRVGNSLATAFAGDSAMEIELIEAQGIAAGAAALRRQAFDVVLIGHEPPDFNALEFVDALRAASCDDQPLLVLGDEPENELAPLAFEAGADAYVRLTNISTRGLLWQMARAHERRRLIGENRQLRHDQRHRLQLEHDEADRLLAQQRALIADLQKIRTAVDPGDAIAIGPALRIVAEDSSVDDDLTPLRSHYRELLEAYVIMGSGNLADDLRRLARRIVEQRLSSQQVMRLHLRVLEEAVQGLGGRSSRHVMNRADLLILEVMLHLVEHYRTAADGLSAATHQIA